MAPNARSSRIEAISAAGTKPTRIASSTPAARRTRGGATRASCAAAQVTGAPGSCDAVVAAAWLDPAGGRASSGEDGRGDGDAAAPDDDDDGSGGDGDGDGDGGDQADGADARDCDDADGEDDSGDAPDKGDAGCDGDGDAADAGDGADRDDDDGSGAEGGDCAGTRVDGVIRALDARPVRAAGSSAPRSSAASSGGVLIRLRARCSISSAASSTSASAASASGGANRSCGGAVDRAAATLARSVAGPMLADSPSAGREVTPAGSDGPPSSDASDSRPLPSSAPSELRSSAGSAKDWSTETGGSDGRVGRDARLAGSGDVVGRDARFAGSGDAVGRDASCGGSDGRVGRDATCGGNAEGAGRDTVCGGSDGCAVRGGGSDGRDARASGCGGSTDSAGRSSGCGGSADSAGRVRSSAGGNRVDGGDGDVSGARSDVAGGADPGARSDVAGGPGAWIDGTTASLGATAGPGVGVRAPRITTTGELRTVGALDGSGRDVVDGASCAASIRTRAPIASRSRAYVSAVA